MKAIIFDFDGTLIDSVEVKNRAFRKIFSKYPEYSEELYNYHLNNNGASRVKKFNYLLDLVP